MEATLYAIQGRARTSPANFADVEQFTLDEGIPVSPQILVDEPYWTPYCLDDENRRVLFVKTPPEVDLAAAAFVYSTQFESAHSALALPYAALDQLSEKLESPKILIPIYSIGRCGSTLMSQIFDQIDGVYSLSEPDVFTNISMIRSMDKTRDAELTSLLKFCTLLLSRRGDQRRPTAVVHKYRSHALEVVDLMNAVFPNARNIFMYRNADTWAGSVSKFLQRLGVPNEIPGDNIAELFSGYTGADPAYVKPYIDEGQDVYYYAEFLAVLWTWYLYRYMTHYESGVVFHTIRYEDLTNQREATVRATFDYCGLPISDDILAKAMKGFDTESQAGTILSNEVPAEDLPPERVAAFMEMLSRHPRFNQPDYGLPDIHTSPSTS
jgi:hypothetical protein